MTKATKYMAAAVPRFLRQKRLRHLPPSCVIASYTQGDAINSLVFDVVMLPAQEFRRMGYHVGMQLTLDLTLEAMKFNPSFVPRDVKVVTVPDNENEPESYARDYFLGLFKASKSIAE